MDRPVGLKPHWTLELLWEVFKKPASDGAPLGESDIIGLGVGLGGGVGHAFFVSFLRKWKSLASH